MAKKLEKQKKEANFNIFYYVLLALLFFLLINQFYLTPVNRQRK